MKRTLGIALVLIAGALVCGCGGSDKPKDDGLRSVIGGKQASAASQGRDFASEDTLAMAGG